jgi:glycosyltransferase involved in cell wall biosynthesis
MAPSAGMRVAHVVPALFGPDGIVGGAERYAFELARHMAAHVPTTLVTFGDRDRHEREGPLEVKVIGNPWYVRGQRTNPFDLRLFAAIGGVDIVHCHQQHIVMSSAAALWCRARRRRVFVSELGGGGWDVSAYVSTDGWFHGHLHLSDYSRRIYRHEGAATAHVIGGGVDVDKFSPDASVVRDGSALFVGRILPHKGIDDLIRGLPPGMPLAIVGPRPDDDTAAMLADLAAGRNVSFKHGLDDDGIVREYRRASCIVLPSVYRTSIGTETAVPELLGQTLLEGMACEAPAICTNVASLPEIVDNGMTGFVVPPNDPVALGERLRMFHLHPELVRSMGRAGRERVLERFTWSRVVQRCLDAYESALRRPQHVSRPPG